MMVVEDEDIRVHPSDGETVVVFCVFCGWRMGGIGGSGRFRCLKSVTPFPRAETDTDEPVDNKLDPVDVVDEADVDEELVDTMDDAIIIQLKSMDKSGFSLV